jgi:hypothetical protein
VEEVATPGQVAAARAAVDRGEWCDFAIVAQGPRVIVRLNGVTIVDTRDEHPTKSVARGMLGMEYTHRQGETDFVEFKDIRYKRLVPEPAPQAKRD